MFSGIQPLEPLSWVLRGIRIPCHLGGFGCELWEWNLAENSLWQTEVEMVGWQWAGGHRVARQLEGQTWEGAEAWSPSLGWGGSNCCCLVGVSSFPSAPVLSSRKAPLLSTPGLESIQSSRLCPVGKKH